MVMSMTGYGDGEAVNENGTVRVEIRSVNHRYFETVFRLPSVFMMFEQRLRKRIAGKIGRGRLEIRIFFDAGARAAEQYRLDPAVARQALAALIELETLTGQFIENKPALIAGLDGVMSGRTIPESGDEAMLALVLEATDKALAGLMHMRESEGGVLADNILALCDALAESVGRVEAYAADMPARQRAKLVEGIQTLLGEMTDEYYPGQRLAAEVALLIDRLAIDEEIVRLKSHIEQVRQTIALAEPIGKRLDFLAQEMNREVNTIGSKTGDLADLVVMMKNDVEKFREQVQNVE